MPYAEDSATSSEYGQVRSGYVSTLQRLRSALVALYELLHLIPKARLCLG